MVKLDKLFTQIMDIVNDPNLEDWSEDCHPAIMKLLHESDLKVSELINEDITMGYFNSMKVTYFRFQDFIYNYCQ